MSESCCTIHSWRGTTLLVLPVLVVTVSCNDLIQCSPEQCNNVKSPLEEFVARKDRGGLNTMCEAAEGTRKNIINDELPYGFAAEQAKAW